jgi:hypothetical protein
MSFSSFQTSFWASLVATLHPHEKTQIKLAPSTLTALAGRPMNPARTMSRTDAGGGQVMVSTAVDLLPTKRLSHPQFGFSSRLVLRPRLCSALHLSDTSGA